MVSVASSATISGGRWFVGSLEQTLPPIVPRFRTCTSAIWAQTSPRIGRARASALSTISVYVVIAPTRERRRRRARSPFSSSMPARSTRASGEAARAFMTLTIVWPPASARAPSFDPSRSSASASVQGLAYPTSRAGTGQVLAKVGDACRSSSRRASRASRGRRRCLPRRCRRAPNSAKVPVGPEVTTRPSASARTRAGAYVEKMQTVVLRARGGRVASPPSLRARRPRR